MKRWPSLVAITSLLLVAPAGAGAQTPIWKIDPNHSELSFRIRHYVTKVRGTFGKWSGTITADPAALDKGAVDVSIDARSIDTNNEMRDGDLRSNNFFAADSFPSLTFRSTRVDVNGGSIKVFGDLTIRGITKPVVLAGSYNGVARDAQGKERIGFEASTRINRLDHKVSWNRAIEGGGVMLGDEVEINITIEAVRQ